MTDPATLIGLLADAERRRVFAAITLGARSVAEVVETSGLEEAVQAALLLGLARARRGRTGAPDASLHRLSTGMET